MRRLITYVFDEDDKFDFYAVRIEVKTINLGELGEYSKLSRMYSEHAKMVLDGEWADMSKEERLAADPVLVTRTGMYRQWAHMKACLRSVRVATDVKMYKKAAWNEASLADLGWADLEGLVSIPLDLFQAWDREAQECNPGIFGPVFSGTDEEQEKKVGIISVV